MEKGEYSDRLKNTLSDVYRYVNRHKDGNFTVDNVRGAYVTMSQFSGNTDTFVDKFIRELDLIKTIEAEQPYKTIVFVKEHSRLDGSGGYETFEVKSEPRTYYDYDLREMEYRIGLNLRHHKRLELIKTNIK